MSPIHNPAGSFDFGAQLWGMGEPPEAAEQYDSFGHCYFDQPTIDAGWKHIQASYEQWCDNAPPIDASVGNPFT